MLSGITQRVMVNDCLSDIIYVISRIGQESHLGPILFSIFLNDISNFILNSEFLLFADDLKLYKKITNENDRSLLQGDLINVLNWSLVNGLPLNIEKCYSISFGRVNLKSNYYAIGDDVLKNVSQIKDLGVIIDDKLSFYSHLSHVQISAMRAVNFIKRFARNFKDKATFWALYYSFVYPKLTYCAVVWRPYNEGQIRILKSVLHAYVRYASYRVGRPMQVTSHDYQNILAYPEIPDIIEIIEVASLGPKFNLKTCFNESDAVTTIKNVENQLNRFNNLNLFQKNNIRSTITQSILYNLKNKPSLNKFVKQLDRNLKSTKKFLKNNNDIFFTKADKGNVTVCLDKLNYCSKMEHLLSDKKTYEIVKKNPLNNLRKNVYNLLKYLNEQNFLPFKYHKNQLTQTDTNLARAYGLPKIHKPDIPLRPVISLITFDGEKNN